MVCGCCAQSAWSQTRVFFTAPFGEGGTWNLYEVEGLQGSANPRLAPSGPMSQERAGWQAAMADAESRVERISGKRKSGHLATIGSAEENAAIRARVPAQASYWIGLTDSEAFGGSETASQPPVPAIDGLKGLNGQPGDGWKWTNGDGFEYAHWSDQEPAGGEGADYVGVRGGQDGAGEWFDSTGVEPWQWVVEYDTEMPYDFLADRQPLGVTGPAGGWGTWGVREITGVDQAAGLYGALETLLELPEGAKVVDYQTPVLDYNDYQSFPIFGATALDRRFETPGALDNVALVAHGTIRIPEGKGGEWKFRVGSDDAAELYFSKRSFTAGSASEGQITPYGSLAYLQDRRFGVTEGSIQLDPGDYEVEVVYQEHVGDAGFEVSAMGPGDSAFALIGDPGQTVHGATPSVPGYFHVQMVRRIGNGVDPIDPVDSLAEARDLLESPGPLDQLTAKDYRQIAFQRGSLEFGWYGSTGNFPGGSGGTQFAFSAEGMLHVATAGEYSLAFHSATGAALSIAGAVFDSASGAGHLEDGGHTLVADQLERVSLAAGSLWLDVGDYPLELLTYNDTQGGALIELLVSPGPATSLPARGAYRLLTDVSQTVDLVRPAGLQLIGPAVAGDVNGDGRVDLTDFGALKANFGSGTTLAQGDCNADGKIDLADFAILKSNFGTAAIAAPEPAPLGMMACGLIVLAAGSRLRRRSSRWLARPAHHDPRRQRSPGQVE